MEIEAAAYRDFVQDEAVGDVALRAAARNYDLVGEVRYGESGERWTDRRALGALVVLETIADGYAMRAIEWPDGLDEEALPGADEVADLIDRFGTGEWIAETLGSAPPQPRSRRLRLRRPTAAYSLGVDATLEDWRAKEKPGKAYYSNNGWTAAQQFADWLEFYWGALAALASPHEPEGTLEQLRDRRQLAISSLAYLRRWIPQSVRSGNRAEATASMSLMLEMVRSTILGGLQEHLETSVVPHMVSGRAIKETIERYDLESWLAAPTRPPG